VGETLKIAASEMHRYFYRPGQNPAGALSRPAAGQKVAGNQPDSAGKAATQTETQSAATKNQAGNSAGTNNEASALSKPGGASSSEVTPEERAVINDLKKTDKEVRAHEAAHVAAGGQYVTGGAQFEYQTGPDGKKYAVGGEVQIDTSSVPDDPEATIAKMQVVKRAALAPGQPSSQDRSVAAAAARIEAEARQQLSSPSSDNKNKGSNPADQYSAGGNKQTGGNSKIGGIFDRKA